LTIDDCTNNLVVNRQYCSSLEADFAQMGQGLVCFGQQKTLRFSFASTFHIYRQTMNSGHFGKPGLLWEE